MKPTFLPIILVALRDQPDHGLCCEPVTEACDLNRMVERDPAALNIDSFKRTIQHAKEILGQQLDINYELNNRPGMIFRFQRAKDLIPYDEVPTQQP